jgi:hypothetical protein
VGGFGGGGWGVLGGNGVAGGGARGGGISKFAAQGKGEHVHKATGYAWDRVEDEPGYIWMNKRAMEEGHRAWDVIVDKGSMIKSEFGLEHWTGRLRALTNCRQVW